MDHSGLDRELINSPLACWDSRQGELSASSVSGRAQGELLQSNCRMDNPNRGCWIRACVCATLWVQPSASQTLPVTAEKSSSTSLETNWPASWEAVTNKYSQWIVNYQVEHID